MTDEIVTANADADQTSVESTNMTVEDFALRRLGEQPQKQQEEPEAVEPEAEEEEEQIEELQGQEATRFRAVAAISNYLAADRPDIQYSVKEFCRRMAKPVGSDWKKLKNFPIHARRDRRENFSTKVKGIRNDIYSFFSDFHS